jgi:tetratricopeptide (TPR) repeat protein
MVFRAWRMRLLRNALIRSTAVCCLALAVPCTSAANPESVRHRVRAYEYALNLDYDEATREMEAAVKADPADPAAERGLATIPWLMISFRRGAVVVDEYLGSITRQNVALREPPADLATRFNTHITRATMLADTLARDKPKDAEVHYQIAATVALQASYIATVEGRIIGAFRAARRAYDEGEAVLELDPARKDAALVVGMYRYVVSLMSMPLRLMAYVAGFGGGKERGLEMVEEAARYASESQAEARFALVLLYNREARYAEALRQLAELQRRYPRNRLLWLETGATALRGGRAAEAETQLTSGLRMLSTDNRPRMFGEDALWYQKRGAARVALRRLEEAEMDLRRAVSAAQSRTWVKGRAYAELGKISDLRGNRSAARANFQQALMLCEQDNDPAGAATARQWIDTPFR